MRRTLAAADPVAECSPVLSAPAHKPLLKALLAPSGTWGSLSAEEVLGLCSGALTLALTAPY